MEGFRGNVKELVKIYKSCSKCGKIHNINYKCTAGDENKIKYNTQANRFRKTNKWKTKSEEIQEKSLYLCSVCKDRGIYNYRNIEIHHITPLKDAINLGLDNYNLVCLCHEHHKEAEKGKLDKDYLLRLAKDREDN